MKQLSCFLYLLIFLTKQISAQELKIKTGFWGGIKYLSNNEKISENEFDEILKTRTSDFQKFESYRENYKTYNFLTYLGSSITGIGLGMFYSESAKYGDNKKYKPALFFTVTGLTTWISTAISKNINKNRMKSFLYKSNPSSSFNIRLAPTALGLSYNFNEKKTTNNFIF